MKYIFTSQFLKVSSPATSFADAWELLCLDLLRASNPQAEFQHLLPPDRGVDILSSRLQLAVQCKADERGAYGTAQKQASIDSFRTAVAHASGLGWRDYQFATNADFSGSAVEEIYTVADALGVSRSQIAFKGPQYWSDLCEAHLEVVQDRLDYRLQVSEAEVIEAFRNARYYESKVKEYETLIQQGHYQLQLRNNRTPLTLCIPFAPELTIGHCLRVAMQLLDISLDSKTYADLETSVRPSISIAVDRIPQEFEKKIGELSEDELGRLQLWITINWKDETSKAKDGTFNFELMHRTRDRALRKSETLRRFESELESRLWAAGLKFE